MATDKDRRKAPRQPSNLPLDIYDTKGRAVVGEGRFVNMSTLGALMVSKKPLKKRDAVRLHVIPAGKPALELTGKIVWTRRKVAEFEYGICFNPDSPTPLNLGGPA